MAEKTELFSLVIRTLIRSKLKIERTSTLLSRHGREVHTGIPQARFAIIPPVSSGKNIPLSGGAEPLFRSSLEAHAHSHAYGQAAYINIKIGRFHVADTVFKTEDQYQ